MQIELKDQDCAGLPVFVEQVAEDSYEEFGLTRDEGLVFIMTEKDGAFLKISELREALNQIEEADANRSD